MITTSITIPPEDVARLEKTFDDYVVRFNGNVRKAVEKTAVKIVVALRASTRKSPALRRIVKNPYRGEKGSNRALAIHQNIQEWYELNPNARKTKRQNIMLKAGLPRLKEVSDKNRKFARFAIEAYTGKSKRYIPIPRSNNKNEAKRSAEMLKARQYFLDSRGSNRRGIAYSSWGWILGKLGKSIGTEQQPIAGTTSVSSHLPKDKNATQFFVLMINSLSYIRNATKENVTSAFERARRMMENEIQRHASSGLKQENPAP